MADQEQVDLLNQGVDVWNVWREKNKGESIDLSNANLSSTRLLGANLSNTNLRNANLSGAILFHANLSNANLDCANLDGAELSFADLLDANLNGSNLSEAQLISANLDSAQLLGANLYSAKFNAAKLNGAQLFSANLSGAGLSYANLSGANLTGANIESAILDYAVVDGETLIIDCKINDSTYVHGVGLDSARIEESLKTKLKKNIRKKYWVEKYQYHLDLESIKKLLMLVFSRRLLIAIHKWTYSNITRELTKQVQRSLFSLKFLKSSISVFGSCLEAV